MLLVDADHAERRQRREDGRPGADDDRRLAGDDPLPLVPPLGLREAGVEQRNPVAEARAEAAERLRCQRDLGHEHDRAPAGSEGGLAGADVDLGLAAAGRAGEEDVPAPTRKEAFDSLERALLRLGKPVRRRLGGETRRRRDLAPLAAALRLVRRDQRERAGRRRAVVVREPEREIDERRGKRLEHALRRDRLDVGRRLGVGVDDHAAAPGVAEGDREDGALLHLVPDLVRERPREGARADDRVDGGEAGHGAASVAAGLVGALLSGLQLPRGDDRVLHGVGIPVLEVGHDHHVLREPARGRERLGKGPQQQVAELERRPDDDVRVVELPRHESPVIPPLEQALAAALGDAVELSGEAAEIVHHPPVRMMPRRPATRTMTVRTMQGGEE